MTAPQADYRFFIDWADDGYKSAQAAIPVEHVQRYEIDYGCRLTVGSHGLGADVSPDGVLSLFESGGLYWHGGALSDATLRAPHAWKLEIDGELERSGRAVPVLGRAMGTRVQPQQWRLEGPNLRPLQSQVSLDGVTGNVRAILAEIGTQGGPTVTTTDSQPFSGRVTYFGHAAGLISQIAELIGGWPVEAGSGAMRIITPANVVGGTSVATITKDHNIGLNQSGVGVCEGLVRTHYRWPALSDSPFPISGVNASTWGQSTIQIPEDWFDITDLVPLLAGLRRLGTPPEYVQLDLADVGDDALLAVMRKVTPGNVVTAQVPRPGGTDTLKTMIGRITLTGGAGQLPRRFARGWATPNDPGEAPPGTPNGAMLPAGSPPQPQLSKISPTTIQADWTLGKEGPFAAVNLERSPDAFVNVTTVSSGNTTGLYLDMPGDGTWWYRLRNSVGPGVPSVIACGGRPPPPRRGHPGKPGLTLVPGDPSKVRVFWDATFDSIDIARAPSGERGILVSVVATDLKGSFYDDSPPGAGSWEYRLRYPTGSEGEWGPWGGPISTERSETQITEVYASLGDTNRGLRIANPGQWVRSSLTNNTAGWCSGEGTNIDWIARGDDDMRMGLTSEGFTLVGMQENWGTARLQLLMDDGTIVYSRTITNAEIDEDDTQIQRSYDAHTIGPHPQTGSDVVTVALTLAKLKELSDNRDRLTAVVTLN